MSAGFHRQLPAVATIVAETSFSLSPKAIRSPSLTEAKADECGPLLYSDKLQFLANNYNFKRGLEANTHFSIVIETVFPWQRCENLASHHVL